jgi:hypothetical protein
VKNTILSVAIATLVMSATAANAVEIANWTFEVSVPTSAGPFSPESGAGAATGFHTSTAAVYSNPSGNGSVESFSSNNWGVGDYYQFQVSTTGLFGVRFQFDQASSNTGPRDFQIQYSTDGSTFTDFGSVYTVLANASPNNPWNPTTYDPAYSFDVDMSSVTALDNQANIYLRLTDASTVSANGGTVATAGTNRVDNVIVSANPVPEPASMLAIVTGIGALAARRRRR